MSSLPWTSGEQTLASSWICLVECHGIKPWREEGPGELVNIQGLPPPTSEAMHPNKQEVRQKCWEVCVDEQGAPGQTQTGKEVYRG